jgi:branched-chain amino acid transport system ATP-binding protein
MNELQDVLLDVRELNAWYGESHVLHGVDLIVKRGQTVSILGRNGAGKTTTLRAIVGIVRRRSGSVRLGRHDLIATPLHKCAKAGLGYVPEERGIFSTLTVEENLFLPTRVGSDSMTVSEIYELFPNLRERRSSPGTRLSGGEQQMLAIGRILRTGARILLFDEPTEGLAPVIVRRIGAAMEILKARGFTIVLVEQNFRFAKRYSDYFYVMEDGRMIDAFAAADIDARAGQLNTMLGV